VKGAPMVLIRHRRACGHNKKNPYKNKKQKRG
jgi:hypothetical protein